MKTLKRFLCLTVAALSVFMVEAQELGVIYRKEVVQFKGDVCKLTVKINYWDRETWTYWYNESGRVVRYRAQKFRGEKQPVSEEIMTLSPEGKMLRKVVSTYQNGILADTQNETCKEYNGGNVVDIPIPKLEAVYYKVPGKVDSAGNWLQISRSYGNYSHIISREIEYHSSMSAATKAEFKDIENSNISVKKHFEEKARIEAEQKEREEKGAAYSSLVISIVGCAIFLLLCNNIWGVMTYRKKAKKVDHSKWMPKDTKNMTDEQIALEYSFNKWMDTNVNDLIDTSDPKPSLSNYNRHPKSLYYKVLLAVFLFPMMLTGAFTLTSDYVPFVVKIIPGIIVAFGLVVALWWLIWGIRTISKNMVLNRTLKNRQITMFMLAMVIETGVLWVYPYLSSEMPGFIAAFLTFVALCFYYAFMLGGLLTGRCPKCHAYYETESLGQESRGIVTERSREHSSTSKGDYTLRKTYLREKTYEKYATLWVCNECGYEWEVNNRRLIRQKDTLEDVDIDD